MYVKFNKEIIQLIIVRISFIFNKITTLICTSHSLSLSLFTEKDSL